MSNVRGLVLRPDVNNTPEMEGSATFWAESVTEVQL